MVSIRVHRSPLCQFMMGIAGLILLVAAIDIAWTHNVSLEPEADENGVRTARGESRFQQDVIVGTAFIGVGGALVVIAVAGLISPRPVAQVGDLGITLRIAGPRQNISLGWEDIAEVRSAREPGDGAESRPLFLVRLQYPDFWPEEYWGARREGAWLIVDAGTWTKPPEEVVVYARIAMTALRRELMSTGDEDV